MPHINKVIAGSKPAFVMVMVQVSYIGLALLFKMVANDGINLSVIMAYRSLVASAFIVPLAYFFEIRKSKPKITSTVLFQAFFCGLFGASLQQNVFAYAIISVEATYITAMYNLVPAVTFILAVCFGLERFDIGISTGKAKVFGSLLGIGGAMILTFYKSTKIQIWSTHVNLAPHLQLHNVLTAQLLGFALAFGYCLSYSIWLIIQARMSEKFPWQYTSAALMSVMASAQSIIFALCIERDWNQWKLGWNIRLLAIVYTGVVTSGIVWLLIAWCVHLKGPFYTSIFNPLHLVLMTIAGYLLLGERLYVGSVIGSLLIVIGLYIVLWGKRKELERDLELKLTKGSLEVEALEIITTNHANGKSVKNDDTEMKSGNTTQPGILMENDHLSIVETEENERKTIPSTTKDSKPCA